MLNQKMFAYRIISAFGGIELPGGEKKQDCGPDKPSSPPPPPGRSFLCICLLKLYFFLQNNFYFFLLSRTYFLQANKLYSYASTYKITSLRKLYVIF